MNKICTDLEQSKRLQSLGIDVNTADMAYWKRSYQPNDYAIMVHHTKELQEGFEAKCIEYIPAWSLTALLGLMPTDDKKDEYYVDTESHSDYHTVSYRNCWDGCVHSEYSEESLLDAAFEIVCWLKENGKL